MEAGAPQAETLWFVTSRVRILVSEDTYSLIEEEARNGAMPPLHVHRDHDEVFYVQKGRLSLFLPGARTDLEAGEAIFAPRGIPHTYRVESEDGARWLVSTNSGAFAAFIEEMAVPATEDGYAPEDAMPTPAELGAAAARAGIEVLGPPGALPD